MVTELREKSQITIPKSLVNEMGLKTGDQFETVRNGNIIQLIPVAVYPKEYVEKLEKQVAEAKQQLESGELKSFRNVDGMLASLKGEDDV